MGKTEENKSLSQTQFANPFGTGEIVEQFEPTWVKLDKQVCNAVIFYLATTKGRAASSPLITGTAYFRY